jgi:hypothetical protein
MSIDPQDQAGDIDRLRALKMDADPRTIGEMIADDSYEIVTVTAVEHGKDGWHYITTDAGYTTGVQGAEPKAGDTVWIYDDGWGGNRHGWALNGKVIEWHTPWERFAERVRWLADHDRRQREDFARDRGKLDAKYEALPVPLKLRIDRFRRESPSFRVESEAYEMAAVGDAPKIARALATARGWALDDELAVADVGVSTEDITTAVKAFYDLDYEAQKAMVPDLDEGHSGNTFGGAVSLASGLLTGQIAAYEAEHV